MSIRAAVMTAPGAEMEVRRIPDAELQPGSVLIETLASEVCGTDVHLHHGRLAGVPYPIIPGHVSVGRVLETRDVSSDALGRSLGPGDVVTFLDVHETCHRCYHCAVAGQPNRCASRKVYGITYPLEAGPLGGWCEHIHLLPGLQVVRLPDGLGAERLIGGGCGMFTGFAAVERAEPTMGDTVVVQGTGPVGLSAAAFAHLRGAGRVIAIGDPPDRLALAERFGADTTLGLSSTSPAERDAAVREITEGRGADIVIEASGNPVAVPEGLDLLRDGGTYVIAGHYTDVGDVSINPHVHVNRKHARVLGRWGTEFRHLVGALRMVRRHDLPFEAVIGGRYGLDEAGRALEDVAALRVTKAVIVPGIRSGQGTGGTVTT